MSAKKNNLIYGRHPVIDAIKSGEPIDKVILQQGTRGEFEKEVRMLTKQFNLPLQYVPKERFSKFTRGNHQGILAFLSLTPFYRLEDMLPLIYEQSEVPLILLLDNVSDVRNFGAIARTAECCGVHTIVISQKGGAQINADAMKASAGALTKIPICREKTISSAIDFLQLSGLSIVATDLKADAYIHELDFNVPIAIIIGSEGKGVSANCLEKADKRFMIPQKGTVDSLNVSVATGMVLYEAMRQRMA